MTAIGMQQGTGPVPGAAEGSGKRKGSVTASIEAY